MSKFIAALQTDAIARFCQRWKVQELALFGSALRDDFGSESDIDLLVSFSQNAEWGLLDHIQMQQELRELLRRDVDLISKRAVEKSENWLRRQEILETAKVLYSSQEAAYATG